MCPPPKSQPIASREAEVAQPVEPAEPVAVAAPKPGVPNAAESVAKSPAPEPELFSGRQEWTVPLDRDIVDRVKNAAERNPRLTTSRFCRSGRPVPATSGVDDKVWYHPHRV
jgi:hypothetical protein